MNCGQKLFNPSSCAARLQQMTHDLWSNYKLYELCSSGAIVTWRTITLCNQNTNQARYGTRPFDVLLSSAEQSRADEASKFCRSIRSNCRIPCHSKLYPLKSGHLATQLLHALSLFYVFKRRNGRLRGYAAKWLRGYGATWLPRLKNELDSCVAFLFRLKDYCFGTLIKERVKFLCSALFSTWKNKHNVQKPRPRSYLAPSLASSHVAP